jgi:hypothetical protein
MKIDEFESVLSSSRLKEQDDKLSATQLLDAHVHTSMRPCIATDQARR